MLQCPAGYTQITLTDTWPQLNLRPDWNAEIARSHTFALPGATTADSFVLVLSRVGHPDRGCPDSGDPTCDDQNNESFDVLNGDTNGTFVGNVPDHGNNRIAAFTFPLALEAGDHMLTFAHVPAAPTDNNPWGSVNYQAAYCYMAAAEPLPQHPQIAPPPVGEQQDSAKPEDQPADPPAVPPSESTEEAGISGG